MQLSIDIDEGTDSVVLTLDVPLNKIDFVTSNIGTDPDQDSDSIGYTEDLTKLGITTEFSVAHTQLKPQKKGDYEFFVLEFVAGIEQVGAIPQFTKDLISWAYTEQELTKFANWWN